MYVLSARPNILLRDCSPLALTRPLKRQVCQMIEQLDTEDNRNRTQHKCEDAGYSNISSFPLVIINYLLKSTFYGVFDRSRAWP